MNIMFTNEDPVLCAREHCTVHVNSQLKEACQMLSTAHHILNDPLAKDVYKEAYPNHPCTIWVREDASHYQWLYKLARELLLCHYKYTGKIHGCYEVLKKLSKVPVGLGFIKTFKEPPCCTNDEQKKLYELGIPLTECYQAYINEKLLDWLMASGGKFVYFDLGCPKWLSQDVLDAL